MLKKLTSKEKGCSPRESIPIIEDLKEDIKEEPTSPESETCHADVDIEDDKRCVQDDKRRTAHTVAEQKRRDAIKKGYDDLQSIVPSCQGEDSAVSPKLSKAVVLQKTVDHLRFILEEKHQQEQEIDNLKKEVLALQIMKANYEQIAKSTLTPEVPGNAVTDEAKFNVFKRIMDAQFSSFNNAAHVTSFSTLSASIFKWLEEECKPQAYILTSKTREILLTVLFPTGRMFVSICNSMVSRALNGKHGRKLEEIVLDSLQTTNINGV